MAEKVTVFSAAWVIGIVGFSAFRALVAWPTLGDFGVNPWVFLFIDLVTAPPYAIGQVAIVRGFIRRDWRSVQLWSLVVIATFLAPYLYIFSAGAGQLPALAYWILGSLIVVFGVASVLRIRNQVLVEAATNEDVED